MKNNFILLYVNTVSQFHKTHLQKTCTSTFMVSILPAAVILTRCRMISWGYFSWLSGASGFQTLPFRPVIFFFDDYRCFRHHQVLEGNWPGHADDLHHDLVHYLCFYLCLYPYPCLYLLVLFLLRFPGSSLFLLSGHNSVWPGCTMCIIVWFFQIVSETWSSVWESTSEVAI